jgi:hypothetical protein
MLVTWTLIVYLHSYKAGGPAVVDGFATEAGCRAAAAQTKATVPQLYEGGVCIRVERPVSK